MYNFEEEYTKFCSSDHLHDLANEYFNNLQSQPQLFACNSTPPSDSLGLPSSDSLPEGSLPLVSSQDTSPNTPSQVPHVFSISPLELGSQPESSASSDSNSTSFPVPSPNSCANSSSGSIPPLDATPSPAFSLRAPLSGVPTQAIVPTLTSDLLSTYPPLVLPVSLPVLPLSSSAAVGKQPLKLLCRLQRPDEVEPTCEYIYTALTKAEFEGHILAFHRYAVDVSTGGYICHWKGRGPKCGQTPITMQQVKKHLMTSKCDHELRALSREDSDGTRHYTEIDKSVAKRRCSNCGLEHSGDRNRCNRHSEEDASWMVSRARRIKFPLKDIPWKKDLGEIKTAFNEHLNSALRLKASTT